MEKPSSHGLAPILVAITGRAHGRKILHETLLKPDQNPGDIARSGPLPRDQRHRASQRTTTPACPDQRSSHDGATCARGAAVRINLIEFFDWPRTIAN